MNARLLCIATALLLAGPAASGLEADDVIRMNKAGVGEDVILAQMRAAKARFVLTADDIVRLKKEGVSDQILKAMIESATNQPAREAPPQPAAGGGDRTAQGNVGLLVLENLDSLDYSVQVDPEHRNVFFYKASAAEGREPLPARSSQVYRLPPGLYRLTWVAGADSHAVKVLTGRESRATLTRTSADGAEAVYLSLFEDGERRGGGRLQVLSAAPSPVQVAAPTTTTSTVIERHYYSVPAQAYTYSTVSPAPRYRYSRDYECGSRYNWLLPAFSYNWANGRDRYAVGWGPSGNLGFSWHHRTGHSGYTLGWGW